jgi:hypothetical protein
MRAMNRRSVTCGLGATIVALPVTAHAQFLQSNVPWWRIRWKKAPSIAVASDADDFRLPLVSEAILFWNRELAKLGIPFRLGSLTQVAGKISTDDLQPLSRAPQRYPPESIRKVDGDVVVALSDGDFNSFTTTWPAIPKALAAIVTYEKHRPSQDKFARFAIAHELGHVIGLAHNDEPGTLMCGKPASCGYDPWGYHVIPTYQLAEADRVTLFRMYPVRFAAPAK